MRINDQEANRLHVLKAIRRAEPVARTELVKLTGLSSATISDITGELLERGFLLEAKAQGSGRGRPRMQLLLNPGAAYVAGAFLHPDASLTVEISNARGDRIFARTTPVTRAPTVDALAGVIVAAVEETVAASPLRSSQISSVGVALPGVVDSIGGVLHWLQSYPIEPVPIAAMLEDRLQLPVIVDSSTNVIARAEHWFGEDRQLDDFSLFTVGLGMGFSQYLDGMLRAGAHGINSEIGHVKLNPGEGPTCLCGARGCLMTAATMFGAVLRICEARGQPRPRLRHINDLFPVFAREAQEGERTARAVIDQVGRTLGIAVANHINMTDPARVLVLAQDAVFGDLIVAPFYAALQENTFGPLRGRIPVQFKIAPEARYSHGAAAMVLERLYRAPAPQKLTAPA
jgi:predicted NBD/HSP70 family sugar kinase